MPVLSHKVRSGNVLRCLNICEVNAIYIGKTFIEAKETAKFDISNPKTWGRKGMCDRRKDHQKNYDIQYFTVVAVVNEYSI